MKKQCPLSYFSFLWSLKFWIVFLVDSAFAMVLWWFSVTFMYKLQKDLYYLIFVLDLGISWLLKSWSCTEGSWSPPEANKGPFWLSSPEEWALETMSHHLQEEAVCPVCQEIYLNPTAVSCAHTFCFHCTQTWMGEQKDLKSICPVCRVVTENPLLEAWNIRELILLMAQHGSQLEEGLHRNNEYLKFWADITLDAATTNPFLVLSEDLRSVQCGKMCQNLMEGPQRFLQALCPGHSVFHLWLPLLGGRSGEE